MSGDMSISADSRDPNQLDMEFNEGQTIFSLMRFCLVMIISCGPFYSMDIVVCVIAVLVACPFYLINSLIMV
jgi:hypothetical protein